MKLGANYQGKGNCEFVVWAPFLNQVCLKITSPEERTISMYKQNTGYWQVLAENVFSGARYFYDLDNRAARPDPASFYQPEGVHQASEVIDHAEFIWGDSGWITMPLEQMIIYELHVATFSRAGTFEGVINKLDYLKALGVNALEIMPVAQFSGQRNWGYDGAYPFAVQDSYGGPLGLKQLVNACHKKGFALILDVVYNHFGPEGSYIGEFGPYFTDKYKTPWGKAINFDDAYSDAVRNYFIQNALYWFEKFHIDALRLDAIHGIYDMSAKHILKELTEETENFSNKQKRKFYLIAESDLNDARVIRNRQSGGFGISAQWCDDFHHSLHALLTGEDAGYYADFGKISDLVKSLSDGFVYSGQYSNFRKRRHGSFCCDIPASRFVAFIQNHDQVGNRLLGERLSQLVSFEALKLAAGALFVSAFIPLIFMGEEFAADTPFLYFISHSDPELINAVRLGREKEFAAFNWKGSLPGPQDAQAFLGSRLKWNKSESGRQKIMLSFYKELIKLRKELPALINLNKDNLKARGAEDKNILFIERWHSNNHVYCIMNFSDKPAFFLADFIEGQAIKVIDSSEKKWLGAGSALPGVLKERREYKLMPQCFVLYQKEEEVG